MLRNLSDRGSQFLERPARALCLLIAVALSMEIAQYVPEAIPGAHAIGEVVRNLAYALIGAVVFHWLIVQIPTRRRQRAAYAFNEMAFRVLLIAEPGLLKQYQHAAEKLGEDLDIWHQESLSRFSIRLNEDFPGVFGPDRAGLLHTTVEIGVPRAMADLSRSASYLHPDVAHALSQFPLQEGLTTVLQVRRTPSGGVEPAQDAHITWSLLEAARRLYAVLLSSGAYDSRIFQGFVGDDPPMKLTPDVLIKSDSG